MTLTMSRMYFWFIYCYLHWKKRCFSEKKNRVILSEPKLLNGSVYIYIVYIYIYIYIYSSMHSPLSSRWASLCGIGSSPYPWISSCLCTPAETDSLTGIREGQTVWGNQRDRQSEGDQRDRQSDGKQRDRQSEGIRETDSLDQRDRQSEGNWRDRQSDGKQTDRWAELQWAFVIPINAAVGACVRHRKCARS